MTRRFLMTMWAGALLAVTASADVKLSADVKDGESISGVRHIIVTVTSKNPVNSVEFYVNGDLRFTDDSTPYEFDLDGITEPEGPITLKIAAFTSEGEKAEQTLKLTIDNGLSKGAASFVDAARAGLTSGKFEDAITNGRLALKADSNNIPARLVLARTYFAKRTYDEAQKYAEDVVSKDAKNIPARDLLSAILLKKSFTNMAQTRTRDDQVDQLRASLTAAVAQRTKVYDIMLDQFGPVTDANLISYADLALKAGRYTLAIEKLSPVFRRDYKNVAVADRLAYAYMRSAKYDLAAQTLTDHIKRQTPDAFGSILAAINASYQGSESASRGFETQAIDSAGRTPAVLSGRGYLALVRSNTKDLNTVAKSFIASYPQSPVANYYESIALAPRDFGASRDAFETAVLAEPAAYDLWLQKANESISSSLMTGIAKTDQNFSRDVAEVYLDSALAARPDSFEALTYHSILSVYKGSPDEAYRWAKAAVAAGPGYAAGHYALALAASLQNKKALDRVTNLQLAAREAHQKGDNENEAKYTKAIPAAQSDARKFALETEAAMKMCTKLDPTNLGGRSIPDALTAWNHINRYGRTPLLDWSK